MKILTLFTAVILLFTVYFACAQQFPPAFSVNTNTNQIVDEFGRTRFFRGLNVVTKGEPWLPETNSWNPNTSFVDRDMAAMQDLGLNAIRLGTMFPGVMPTAGPDGTGLVNQTYLTELQKIVTKAYNGYGIHSLLDMHQDSGARAFCGEGFPDWWVNISLATTPANASFPWPIKPPYQTVNGIPTREECLGPNSIAWAEGYPTYATSKMFGDFYANVGGMRDLWVKCWQTIASAFNGFGASVLGLGLLNEPWVGDIYKDILLMIPGEADKKNLLPTWDAASLGIRAANTEALIFFEGVTFDWLGVGFDRVPLGAGNNKSVIGFHYYVPPDIDMPLEFGMMKKDAQRINSGLFLSEFGVSYCRTCSNQLAGQLMDEVDEELINGWLAWDFKPFDHAKTGYGWSLWTPTGEPNLEVRKKLARTYAQAVAGIVQFMKFNATTGDFVLSYNTDASITNPETIIYYNTEFYYPNTVSINATASNGANVVISGKTNRTVSIFAPVTNFPSGTNIIVTITEKSSSSSIFSGIHHNNNKKN